MLTTILGLPTHPLLVHGVVVLLPLLALGTGLLSWRPAWWSRLAIPVAAANLVVFALTFLAKESGERLEHQVPKTAAVHEHAEVGDLLPALAGLLFVCALVPAYLAWRARRGTRAATPSVMSRDETVRRSPTGLPAPWSWRPPS